MNQEQVFFLLQGAWGTFVLSVLTFVFASVVGLLIALMRVSANSIVRTAAFTYIQAIQGTPLLVLMGVCFYGPTILGFTSVPALTAAVLALTIQSSAFLGEIWRGCIESVPKNQW
ncbi:MAG TPA: ABC transporter permease subunit, partial [Advenella sp.]|nr:ABC transporter permease subunit [Advenella sp.]